MALTVADRMAAAAEEAAGETGAIPAALVSLDEWAGGRPIEVLAGALGVTHSRAVRVIDRLEADGLARRRREGRTALVELTAAGRRRAERISKARAAVLERALGGLDAGEREQIGALAARVLANLAETHVAARRVCRLCDVTACGYREGRCPITNAIAEHG
jgi:DNA-binding MarR family transcriptional regulator